MYDRREGHDLPARLTDDPEPGTAIEWTVEAPPLKSGENEIAVWLTATDAGRDEPLILADVRVSVTYR